MRTLLALAGLLLAPTAARAEVPSVIRVEIDYMETQFHDHRPTQATIDAVIRMFACHGITLVVEIGDAIPEVALMRCSSTPGQQDFFSCSGPDSFASLKSQYKNSDSTWHYCIFGHFHDDGDGISRSGLGEIGGDDLIVTLGAWTDHGTPFERAATFAHELGHNLGLRHFSPDTPVLSRGPYAPNYASIMSYHYQLRGVKTQLECTGLVAEDHLFKDLDYSNGRMPAQQELFLDEVTGLGINPVDWDCSGAIEGDPKTFDIDGDRQWCDVPGGIGLVYDHDDWSNLVDFAESAESIESTVDKEMEIETCITAQEARALAPPDPGSCPGPAPDLVSESCGPGGLMVWVDPTVASNGTGTGDSPRRDIDVALLQAPPGSVFYLLPGNHSTFTGMIEISTPAILAGPGGAVVQP